MFPEGLTEIPWISRASILRSGHGPFHWAILNPESLAYCHQD
jgi:hypothetical protein